MNKTLVALTLLLATSYAWITADVTAGDSIASTNGIQIYGTTSDKIGNTVANAGDFNNDGYQDYLIGTANSRAYLIFGQSSARTAALNLVASGLARTNVLLLSFAGSQATGKPVVVSAAGDMNKDGYDDIALGLPNFTGRDSTPADVNNVGIVAVVYGMSTTALSALTSGILMTPQTDATTVDQTSAYFYIRMGTVTSGNADTFLGASIASAGDLMRDSANIDDLVVGAPGANNGAANDGKVFIITGKAKTGTPAVNTRTGSVDVSTLAAGEGKTVSGVASAGAKLGASVAGVEDVNGDDLPDVLIGAPAAANGKVYIIYGAASFTDIPVTATQAGGSAFTVLIGETASDQFGWNVGTAGDLNGDGKNDYFVGAPKVGSGAGRVYVFWGKGGSSVRATLTVADNMVIGDGIVITGAATSYLGHESDGGVDVNNDQVDDLVACAPAVDYTAVSPSVGGSSVGKCYVIYGKQSIASLTVPPAAGAGITITGTAGAGFGKSVSAVGDVNNDQGDDFVISAPEGTATGVVGSGHVYEFHGVGVEKPPKSGFRLGASLLVFMSFFAALLF